MSFHRVFRSACPIVGFISVIASSGVSFAQGDKSQSTCSADYKNGVEAEEAGRLREARDLYSRCAKMSCGSFLLQECTARHTRLDTDIPSVVLVVSDAAGRPIDDVEVSVDGESFADEVDGRSLPIDPGMHEFVFSVNDRVIATQKLLIVQGDRNRRIEVSYPSGKGKHAHKQKNAEKTDEAEANESAAEKSPQSDKPAQSEAQSTANSEEPKSEEPKQESSSESVPPIAPSSVRQGPSPLAYVLGGVGLVGVGGFGLLTYWGRKDNDALGQCSPRCPQSSVDHVKRMYLGADVSLGVGAAALGSAVLVYALTRSPKQEKPPEEAYSFGVQPTHSGAVASVTGTF